MQHSNCGGSQSAVAVAVAAVATVATVAVAVAADQKIRGLRLCRQYAKA